MPISVQGPLYCFEVCSVVPAGFKMSKALPLLVACLLMLASVVCLVHTDGVDAAQAPHEGHRHTSSSSSTHSTLDVHCLVATIPAGVMLAWLSLGTLYALTQLSTLPVLAFPPFIPPKIRRHA